MNAEIGNAEEVAQLFRQVMAAEGFSTQEKIVPDGQFHAVHLDGDKPGSTKAWYILHLDPYSCGTFDRWNSDGHYTWKLPPQKGLSREECAEMDKRHAAAREQQRVEVERVRAKARAEAEFIWKNSPLAPETHPYLQKKKIGPNGAKLHEGRLVLPVRDVDGTLHSLQFISPSGEKRFLPRGRISGGCVGIGSPGKRLYIAEGFATAATIHQVTREAVIAAFSAGNLKPVAEALRKKYPKAELVIAADNDQWTDGNPGLSAAREAAKAVKEKVAVPYFPNTSTHPTDFNDLFRLEGTEVVRKQLRRACKPELLENIPGVLASQVKPEKVNWLWNNWIPRREITMLDGDPGMGKSVITLDLAARVTKGWGMPDGSEAQCPASGVVVVSTEDTTSTTIRPRLEVAGAELSLVRLITEISDSAGVSRLPELARDEQRIEAAIHDVDAALLIVDPLVASLDVKTDTHKDAEVRRNLAVVKRLAVRTGVAVVGLRHFNKAGGGNPLYRGQGSIAFSGAARSVFLAANDPDDPTQRILAVAKSNLAVQPSSLRYQLGPPGETVRVTWEGESPRMAVDLLVDTGGEEGRSERADARELLQEVLAGGPVPQKDIQRMAKERGISQKTLSRAKKDLGVQSAHTGQGRDTKWFWSLPDKASGPSEVATLDKLAISAQITDPTTFRDTNLAEMANSEEVAISDPYMATSEDGSTLPRQAQGTPPPAPQPAPPPQPKREEEL